MQYAAATGTSWTNPTALSGTLAPGSYYLVQESAGTGGTTNLPTPDATGTLALSGTAGKVALVSSTTPLTGANPSGGSVVDLVGFGTTANGFEGSGPTPAPSNTTSVLRAGNGCTDTNNNASDFATGTPNPRNTASTSFQCVAGTTPTASLSVSPASFAENGGTAIVTATLSAAATASVTVNLAFGGTATNGTDYSASASVITIAAGATSGSITLSAIDDATYEGNETVVTSISSVSAGANTGSPNSAAATIVDDDPMPPPTIGARIYQIQGASHVSPMNGMNVSNVPGIVTAVASNGFYMQDGDGDGDPKTSDAVLVFTSTAPTVSVGQEVLVSGVVTEFRPSNLATNLSTTEINSPTITSSSNLFTNNTITPTVIGTGGRLPPTEIIDDDSNGNVETSTTRVFDPTKEGIDFYESLEGMLVRVNNPVATDRTASGTGTAIIWAVADGGANATGRNARGGVTLVERAAGVDYNPEHFEIFTGLPGTNPGASFTLNVGDQLASFNGVMSYFGGNYEILPTTTPSVVTPASTTRGSSTLAPAANLLSVGGYNVENLTVGDAQAKFDGLANDIILSMGAPDIVSISEVQDNNGTADANVVACDLTMAKLLAAINAKAGSAYNYDYRQIDPVDGQDGGAPVGNIRVVQIFNTKRVSFDDIAGGTSTNAVSVVTDANGKPTVSFSPGRIDPTNRAWANGNVTQPDGSVSNYSASRKPLVGEYTFNGRRVFVISNHFTSRIGDDPLFGVDQPPILLSQVQREEQALLVHNFVKSIVAIDANAKVVVLGDFNEYDFGDPLRILRNGPLTSTGADGSEPVLKNLSTELVTDPAERYSYVFNGNSQELDHIFVTPTLLASAAQYQAVHLNAGYATQNSDHDPIVSSYSVPANKAPTANAGGNQTTTPGAAVTLSGSGTDSDGTITSYAWTQTTGPTVALTGASTATLSFTAPTSAATLSFSLTVTDNDGASSSDTATITVPADTSPDAFAFPAISGVDLNRQQTSTAQTITGVNTATPISISMGGTYSINGGSFTSAAGTITNGQSVQVQLTASNAFSSTTQATLTIGDGFAAYSVTTRAANTTPNPFSFNPVTDAAPGSVQISSSIVVMGIEATAAISVSGGQFCINGNSCTAMSGAVVNNGDTVRVQQTASTAFSTKTAAILTIGGVDGSFDVTTVAADTSPDSFSFTPVTNANPSVAQTSNAITVSGTNTAAPISVTNGSYSINGGAFTTTAGSVNPGDSVAVQLTSSSSYGATVNAGLNIGGTAASYAVTTRAADLSPDTFAFAPVSGVAPNTVVASNSITVSGIEAAIPVTVSGGSYSVNGGAYTTTAGRVNPNDVITLQQTSSPNFGTTTTASLTLGSGADSQTGNFAVTTLAADTTPDAFGFGSRTDVALNSVQTSNTVTPSGINTAAPVSITGGSYSINGGSFTTAAGMLNPGDTVAVQLTASAQFSTAATATLTIGGANGSFTVTTLAADTTPDSFSFSPVTGVMPSSTQTSAPVTITGINTASPVGISGGSYSINGGAFTTSAGSIKLGDKVALQQTASSSFSTTTTAVLTIGNGASAVSGSYAVTTLAAMPNPTSFTFGSVSGVPLNSMQTSAPITVAGTNSASPIGVSGGSYSINGGAFTTSAGSINPGDTVSVQQTASGSFSTTTVTTLSIGATQGTYSVMTLAADITPDSFSFGSVSGVNPSTVQMSNVITVSGINSSSPVSITGGSYSVNGAAFVTAAGSVNSGDKLIVQATASASYGTTTQAVLAIGGVSANFTVSTRIGSTNPEIYLFTPVVNAPRGSLQISNAVTISGIDTPVPISVSGGSYSINGAAFTTAAGLVRTGDSVRLQGMAAIASGAVVQVTLDVGDRAGSFLITTAISADTGGGAMNPAWLLPLLALRGLRRRRRS